ncbi:tRNA (adenosine(37)-N6)-threonylcarbamoyltransferase complex ATPase subunit type 1 TsaE [Aquibacillus sp. 3ASR75-11]|uniref:tRNA threonylcarbamoyladenosine biosynthesis protein TsaE n=1 Tax=Terrihalobacillus insolitus TaxID=2950438 RepID=A0A9X3WV28_9BACI|nr:tRNA (adenosine(37)-N6)-threonylcarbamoyltransferase complex ATPase subunit type 1 TsaE [Terrihalobacillus insolitus]MDC3414234.1 tRNA (adenosine(37)-N6)-threonylcarbamoyltransferase complex ATPase subunit type 1 TsaE [Terrihalobacillus insolitus]MDC3426215.1 tRNA (adenosine(37)-N6)-threonylcarbamoyltransferase complex ATPase subunit type 1 TsaE [Terrihalobacillus insolitus]
MESIDFEVKTEFETMKLAESLSLLLRPGDVVTLEGDLGAGKTTFAKGIGRGLGVKKTINSPTFTIVKEYQGEVPFYHMDVYRLENSDEDIGFDDYFDRGGITVIEWASFVKEYLPMKRLDIIIRRLDEQERIIQFYPHGNYFEKICKELAR